MSAAYICYRERSGSVIECFARDRGAVGSSLTGITTLCPLARRINPSLALVQPKKTRPDITEKLLLGCKESNQTDILNTKIVSEYNQEIPQSQTADETVFSPKL